MVTLPTDVDSPFFTFLCTRYFTEVLFLMIFVLLLMLLLWTRGGGGGGGKLFVLRVFILYRLFNFIGCPFLKILQNLVMKWRFTSLVKGPKLSLKKPTPRRRF